MSALSRYAMAVLIALILSSAYLLDGPTEIDAITDVQAEVNAMSGVQQ